MAVNQKNTRVKKRSAEQSQGTISKQAKIEGTSKSIVKKDDVSRKSVVKSPQAGAKKYKSLSKKSSPEKPKPAVKLSSKEAHAKSKSLREERRQKDRSHYDVTVDMKKLWEELRRQDAPKEQRAQLCEQIMKLVRGKERDFVFAHDTTRIFQTLCKYASTAIRSELFASLKESLLEMTKCKYSVFFVRALLRRGTKDEKNFIIEKLMSSARKLLSHKLAGPIVEFAYNEYATAAQRMAFAQQFYGPSFMLSSAGQLPLAQVLEQKPEKKPFILKYMKEALESIVRKEALGYTFVHNLFLEYLTYTDDIERQAMAECLQEHVAHIVHTREGAKAAMHVVWYSSAKGRKLIVKQIKPYLEKLLTEEYGHMVLFSIFDAVDDTKFISKLIIATVIEKFDELVNDKWGRHVIMYLLSPRDTQHVNKEIREFLSVGDGNPFSKKDMEIRQKELRDEISKHALSYATDNLDTLLSNNSLKMLLFAILKHASGQKQHLIAAVVKLYNTPYNPKSPSDAHILDDKPMRFTIRRMLLVDDTGEIAQCFIDGIDSHVLKSYSQTDQGCYFISGLINSSKDSTKDQLIKQINGYKTLISKMKGEPQKALLGLL